MNLVLFQESRVKGRNKQENDNTRREVRALGVILQNSNETIFCNESGVLVCVKGYRVRGSDGIVISPY